MAKSIGATLVLKEGNFFANIKKASESADTLGGKFSGAVSKLKPLKESLENTAKKIMTVGSVVTAAATAVGGYAVKIGTDFQQSSNSIAASVGLSKEQMSGFKDIMKDIYADNYGESFQDIADSISTVAQSAKTLDPSEIKGLTVNAMALKDTFGYDIQESMRAVNMLTEQFGMSGKEAFNLISQGAQQGLDKNGDLLDSINEYSVHFNQIGISAESMFNMLLNGTASGTFSVDKLGDAVKEFGIRVKDGTGDEAFKTLGLSVDATKQAFVTGGTVGQEAFKKVTSALFEMDNKVEQNQLGVQLFGTMWEDLGADGIKALTDLNGEFDMTYDSMNKLKEVKYDDLGSAFSGLKRVVETDLLLPFAERLTPAVGGFVNKLRELADNGTLQVWGQQAANVLSGVIGKFTQFCSDGTLERWGQTAMNTINQILPIVGSAANFVMNHWKLITGAIVTKNTLGAVAPKISSIISLVGKIAPAFEKAKPVIKAVTGGLGSGFGTVIGVVGKIIPIIGAVVSAIGIVPIAITAVVAGFVILWNKCEGFRNFFINAWNGIKNICGTVAESVKNFWTNSMDKIKETASGVKEKIGTAWEGLKEKASTTFNSIKEAAEPALEAAKLTIAQKLQAIKQSYDEHGGGLKGASAALWQSVKEYYTVGYDFLNNLTGGKLGQMLSVVTGKLSEIKSGFINKFQEIKDGIKSKIDGIISSVKSVVDKIKGLFNFEWKMPKIKIPTIEKTGEKTILGIKLLTFGIKWNAQGGIFTKPTVLATNAGYQGFGEAGAEAVLPLTQFWDKLRKFTLESSAAINNTSTRNNVTNNIYVYANDRNSDEVVNEIVYKLKKILDNL